MITIISGTNRPESNTLKSRKILTLSLKKGARGQYTNSNGDLSWQLIDSGFIWEKIPENLKKKFKNKLPQLKNLFL